MGFHGSCTAILLAAGSGERLGRAMPKALVPLVGRPMFSWSLNVLTANENIARVVVVLPQHYHEDELKGTPEIEQLAAEILFTKGGNSRAESMQNAFHFVDSAFVLIHDAARPLLSRELLEQLFITFEQDSQSQGAILANPVGNTLKAVDEDGWIRKTVDRRMLWEAQTPQLFEHQVLKKALALASLDLEAITDDAALAEILQARVKVVPSTTTNFKITTQADFLLAEHLLQHAD